MDRLHYGNNAETIITESVASADTSLTVEDASELPEAPFLLTIEDEIIKVTEVSGNNLTVERAQEGTVADNYEPGTSAENKFTAGTLDEVHEIIESHKADYTQFKEVTEATIGASELETSDKTLRGAINEVFQSGNNVKADTVGALLSLDNSLPLDSESSWDDILSAIMDIDLGSDIQRDSGIIYNPSGGEFNVSLDFHPKTVLVTAHGGGSSSDYTMKLTSSVKMELFYNSNGTRTLGWGGTQIRANTTSNPTFVPGAYLFISVNPNIHSFTVGGLPSIYQSGRIEWVAFSSQ